MGLFSSKTRTYVSSTVYNLAGDEDLRPNFLQTVVIGSVLRSGNQSIGSTISSAIRNGTGTRQRRFYKWCDTNYLLGLPVSSLDHSASVPTDVVRAGLLGTMSLAANEDLKVQVAVIDTADIDYWAENWVLTNRPELTEDDWTADYNEFDDTIVIKIAGELNTVLPASADLIWGMNRGEVSDSRRLLIASYSILTSTTVMVPSVELVQDPVTFQYVLTEVDVERVTITEGPAVLFSYRMGSGNVSFDTLQGVATETGKYFPVIPLRINNQSAADAYPTATFDNITKAYKKLTGGSIDDLLESIEDNESVGDIDYCFLVQGVNLTTSEPTGQEYLYKFFLDMLSSQKTDRTDFLSFLSQMYAQSPSALKNERWLSANSVIDDGSGGLSVASFVPLPLYNQSIPAPQVVVTAPDVNELRVHGTDLPEFDYRIQWNFINETQHIGNGKTFDGDQTRGKMKVGGYWFHKGEDIKYAVRHTMTNRGEVDQYYDRDVAHERVYLFYQHAALRYSRIEIVGLTHKNYVYAGHAVTTTASAALSQVLSEEEAPGESSFLVPLHYPTLTSMGLLKGTQMSSVSSFLVFNSYQQVTQKWYQSGIFKIILVIVIAVVSVVIAGPAGAGAVTGLLGTNAAVGTAIGVTGSALATAIAGSVANALAAMVLSTFISEASVGLFGEKWGSIIGTVVSFMAMQYGSQFIETGSFDIDWSQLMRAENITSITSSVSKAYTQWINADTLDIYAAMGEAKEQYGDELKKIESMADDILGMTSGLIDPMMLTDATEYLGESRETYLGRTLLTGSDIAELTHSMIENFAALSTELPPAIR